MELKNFENGQTIYERSSHIWQVLVPWVTWKMDDRTTPGLITYGRLAEELGYNASMGRLLAQPLSAIAAFCGAVAVPKLNVVVVSRETGQPGAAWLDDHPEIGKDIADVLSHDWRRYRVPPPRQFRSAWEEKKRRMQ